MKKKTTKKVTKKTTPKKCNHEKFFGHQRVSMDVIVDADGNWLEGGRVYDAEDPFGPFTCVNCGKEVADLPEK